MYAETNEASGNHGSEPWKTRLALISHGSDMDLGAGTPNMKKTKRIRTAVFRDREEPMCAKSSADKLDPSRATPKTLSADPSRAKALKEMQLPMLI